MSKAYVVGEKSQILGFKGAGFEIVNAEDGEALAKALGQLARSGGVSIVLVTESMAMENPEALQHFRASCAAILTTIPAHKGSAHLGFNEMRKTVEYSIGVDMLGKE